MRLPEFILHDMDNILAEWSRFASTQGEAGAHLSPDGLRDHAKGILQTIAKDILVHQTEDEQSQKSKGLEPKQGSGEKTAAETHAVVRAQSGFNIVQLAAEYRALRASVLRLWEKACQRLEGDLQHVRRFNEGIDQAVAESIACFNKEVNDDRNLLLGMLGHDMRSPLQVVHLTAAYLSKLNASSEITAAADRLRKGGNRMKALLDDLLDFNRTKLGLGISITPKPVDLAVLFADELERVRLTHPGRHIDLQVTGDVRGVYDPGRLHQLLCNLTVNALKYGVLDAPVQVELTGTPAEVMFKVKNRGPKIEPSMLERIFKPVQRGPDQPDDAGGEGNLGLGLFISREIAQAHGGQIAAESTPSQTVFTVLLPRSRAEALR